MEAETGPAAPRVVTGGDGVASQAWVSAATGAGLDILRDALTHAVRPNQVLRTVHLDLPAAAVRSDLYRRNAVRAERQCDDGSWELDVELDAVAGVECRVPVVDPEHRLLAGEKGSSRVRRRTTVDEPGDVGRGLHLPRFTNVEQDECLAGIDFGFHFVSGDFVIHNRLYLPDQ